MKAGMKARFWMIGVALLTAASRSPASADDATGRTCSNASLSGRYGLATHGERYGVYDASGNLHLYDNPVRVDEVTDETFDGHMTTTQLEYVFANGSSTTPNGFVGPVFGTYQVSADCTGTETFPDFLERVFVLSNGGRTIHILTTKLHLTLPPAASAGVDCSGGCDVAVQFYTDGERY